MIPSIAPRIESLNLSDTPLNLAQWSSLAPLLPHFSCLRKLQLRYMSINPQIFSVLSADLSRVRSLTSLDLFWNPLGAGQGAASASSHPGATSLSQLLSSLTSLQELNLSFCRLDSSDLIILTQSFSHLPSLRCLDLSRLYLDDRVVEPLIAALSHVADLHLLDLSSYSFRFSKASELRLHTALKSHFSHLQLILHE